MKKVKLRPCHHCKKLFGGGAIKFCSRDCYNNSGFHSAFMKNHPNKGQFIKGVRTIYKKKYCLVCEKSFSVPPSGYFRKYCSRQCAVKSEDRNKKISNGLKGKPKTLKHNKKVSQGIIRYYDRIGRKKYSSRKLPHIGRKYKEWRKAVYERDNYTCQKCGIKSGNGKAIILNAHHIKSWVKYLELRYELNNGITYCIDCHKIIHNWNSKKGCISLRRRRK